MFRIRRALRDFFSLSQAQANGIMILIPLLAIMVLSEPIWHWYVSNRPYDDSRDIALLDSLSALWQEDSDTKPEIEKQIRYERFRFDPNTATPLDFKNLGFEERLTSRIIRYRNKGGKFRIKTDLLKMYGMDSTDYHALVSYIDLPDRKQFLPKKEFQVKEKFPSRKASVPSFDLNLADTMHLKRIQGIGDKISARIIKYRDALGGFVRMDQVREVYGLDSVVVKRLTKVAFISPDFRPVRININTSDEKKLAAHPYLTPREAGSIVAYRFQHGEFGSVDDLRGLPILNSGKFLQISPYLTTTD